MATPEIRNLIRRISSANPTWGSPRIVGELAKLGIVAAKSTVEKYRIRMTGSPSPIWRAFLDHHLKDLASIDFFIVPAAACGRTANAPSPMRQTRPKAMRSTSM